MYPETSPTVMEKNGQEFRKTRGSMKGTGPLVRVPPLGSPPCTYGSHPLHEDPLLLNLQLPTRQGSKVPVPNRHLVPSSKENGGKRGKTGENGEKRGKTGENGGKRGENGGKTGENGGNLGGGDLGQDPPTRLLPPPPVYNSVGSIFCKPN